MLYRLVDHYNDNYIDNYNEDLKKIDKKIDKKVNKKRNKKVNKKLAIEENDCFICYEICIHKPIQLECQTTYIKFCGCDSLVHQNCLDKWHKLNKSCPICRMQMSKHNVITNVIFQRNKKLINCYIYIAKNMHIIVAKIFIFAFFSVLAVFYFEIFYTINI